MSTIIIDNKDNGNLRIQELKDSRIQRFKGYYRHGVPVDCFAVDRTFGTEVQVWHYFCRYESEVLNNILRPNVVYIRKIYYLCMWIRFQGKDE